MYTLCYIYIFYIFRPKWAKYLPCIDIFCFIQESKVFKTVRAKRKRNFEIKHTQGYELFRELISAKARTVVDNRANSHYYLYQLSVWWISYLMVESSSKMFSYQQYWFLIISSLHLYICIYTFHYLNSFNIIL